MNEAEKKLEKLIGMAEQIAEQWPVAKPICEDLKRTLKLFKPSLTSGVDTPLTEFCTAYVDMRVAEAMEQLKEAGVP